MAAHGENLVRTVHRVAGASNLPMKPLTSVVAAIRRRMDAVLPQRERFMRALPQLFGNASPRKTILLVAAGLAALGLVFVLLEISVRNDLAREATDAASASSNQMQFGDLLTAAPTSTPDVEFVGSLGAKSLSDAPTLGQASRTPIPLPRPRPKR
jgi:hypothetical protein